LIWFGSTIATSQRIPNRNSTLSRLNSASRDDSATMPCRRYSVSARERSPKYASFDATSVTSAENGRAGEIRTHDPQTLSMDPKAKASPLVTYGTISRVTVE
jgi:hypothetical protein